MKLEVSKSLSNGVFKVDIAFKGYEVFEQGLMEDFGVPELIIPVGVWTADCEASDGKYTITNIESGDSKLCDIEIETEIAQKLDASFRASYAISLSDIEAAGGALDTKIKTAEAKCELFIALIQKEAKEKLDELRTYKSNFESSILNPVIIRV